MASAAVFALATLGAGAARANGRFPTAQQLAVRPGDESVRVLRATFGLLLTKNGGASWSWICESAIGYGTVGQEDPPIAVTAAGSVLVATLEGLAVSTDAGCSWGFAGGMSRSPAIDVTVRPDAPHVALALVSSAAGTTDAGESLYASRLYVTSDDGAHWSPYGAPLDPTLEPTSVEVAAGDPHRVYVTAVRGSGSKTTASLLVSTNDARSFEERAIPIDPATEDAAFIAAVDRTNPGRVYVRTGAYNTSRLFVFDAAADASAGYRVVYSGGPMLGFALSPDGATVYLGGPEDGLQKAATADFRFRSESSIPVGCITLVGSTVYTCVVGGSVLLASSTAGAPLAPALSFADIHGTLECSGGPVATECPSQFETLVSLYGFGVADAGDADAAPADAPADGTTAAPPPAQGRKGCSCGLPAAAPVDLGALGWLVGGGALALRRRRARPRVT